MDLTWIHLWLSAYFMSIVAGSSHLYHVNGAKTDFCHMDTFSASCKGNSIVIMDASFYGRMQTGTCISVNDGIGCRADVTSDMDAKCSGRRECSVSLPDDDLEEHQGNCPKERVRYLHASYHCEEVSHPLERCQPDALLTSPRGVLVNSHVDPSCDWHIRVYPGQRLNLTLYDFGTSLPLPTTDGTRCQKYGNIKEDRVGKQKIICSGRERVRSAYLSETNTVTVSTYGVAKKGIRKAHFVIQYEAVGCADPLLSSNSWMERDDYTVTITCNATSERHTLVCRENEWVGELPMCPGMPGKQDGGQNLWHSLSRQWKSPYGIVVIIGLGVALGIVIGALLLFFVLIYFKRRDYRRTVSRMATDEYDCVPPEVIHTLPMGDRTMQLGDNMVHYGYQQAHDGVTDSKALTRQGTIRSHMEDVNWNEGNNYSERNQCLCDDTVPRPQKVRYESKTKNTFASGVHLYESPK